MKFRLLMLSFVVILASLAPAQVVATPQYTLNLNVLGSGIYGTTMAVDTVFGYQLTTNSQLEGDLLTAPGGGLTSYEGGANYNLCGIKALENLLMLTSLNCGKIQPFAAVVGGFSRVQQGILPTVDGGAIVGKVGISLPNVSGSFAVAAVAEYGDFGPSIQGQSNKGFVFYSGVTFGSGSNAAATQAKVARKQRAEAKQQAHMQAAFCKSNSQAPGCREKS
jgi:hypothetical protein